MCFSIDPSFKHGFGTILVFRLHSFGVSLEAILSVAGGSPLAALGRLSKAQRRRLELLHRAQASGELSDASGLEVEMAVGQNRFGTISVGR